MIDRATVERMHDWNAWMEKHIDISDSAQQQVLADNGMDLRITHAVIAEQLARAGVECPEKRQPEIPVGTAGTATVRGVPGVRVMRCEGKVWTWFSGLEVQTWQVHEDGHVTNFVPDTLLTDEAAEKIRAEERKRITYRFHVAFLDDVDPETVDPRTVHAWLRGGAK